MEPLATKLYDRLRAASRATGTRRTRHPAMSLAPGQVIRTLNFAVNRSPTPVQK